MIIRAKLLHNKVIMCVITRAANTLGFSSLKKEQEQVIGEFIDGKDVFVCLPTGFGKSLCFISLPDLIRAPCDPLLQYHHCNYLRAITTREAKG